MSHVDTWEPDDSTGLDADVPTRPRPYAVDDDTDHGRSWLWTLRPVLNCADSEAMTSQPLIDDVVARVGRGPASWAIETGHRLLADLADEPFIQGGRRSPSRTGFIEAVTLWAVLRLSGVGDPPARLTAEITAAIQKRVPDGVSVDLGLRCLRLAHARLVQDLFRHCETVVPASTLSATMREISDALFDGMETLAAVVTSEFAAEQARWLSGSTAERAKLVSAILDGASITPAKAVQRLRYDVSLHHIALVVWQDDDVYSTGELERTAKNLLRQAGCSSMLMLPVGSGRLLAWGGRTSDRPTELRRLDGAQSSGPHVHVSSGLPGDGLDGFRRSHIQAVAAERVGRTLPTRPGGLHDYGALELVILLGSEIGPVAEFVARELGPLAAADRSMAALRDTVRCYLDQERSVAATSRLLHVAKNTVVYRVHKAEQLLGRSLRSERLRLHTALYLADQLGPAVLLERPSPARGPSAPTREDGPATTAPSALHSEGRHHDRTA